MSMGFGGRPTLGGSPFDVVIRTVSRSSGSVALDACVGGALGYLIGSPDKRVRVAAAGAALAGLAGTLGIALVVGYGFVVRRRSS